ncbi:CHAP domain-containing protein [Fulvivirga sp. 29W222]|uniref:CHAP domain-containing protein n=1 Tax=Fulvivirga marina TaxID=2494733 RepID=A0A937FWM9_9BACT|nr:CHAP domain-containing protein [Fulvivirga marina]MBL6445716.1 CHAP domain-containing protein [Fulvivirga marina]
MAKAKANYLYLLCFLICSGAFGASAVAQTCIEANESNTTGKEVCLVANGASPEAKEKQLRARLKQVYSNQVGVREQGGANRGKVVEQYLAVTGLGPGYAWCSAFVSWCYLHAGVDAPVSAWVPSFAIERNIIYKRGKPVKSIPKSGDVFLIWYDRLNRPAHIGFVDAWGEQYVITVEGNTNDNGGRDGDGVYRKKRLKRQIWAVSDFISSAE